MNKEKILITGGAGYIGSMLTEKLINLGYSVTCLDNFMYGHSSVTSFFSHSNFYAIDGDVRDTKLINNLLPKHDIIIPLAAIVGAPLSKKDQTSTKTTNLSAIKQMIKNISVSQKILFPVTNSGYGIGKTNEYCDENSPLKPLSLYAKTKVEAEKVILNRENSISFRLATVFGPSRRMRIDLLVNDFVLRSVTDKFIVLFEGNFRRNFIHINDVIDAFIFGINNFKKMRNNTFNLGLSEANLTKIELCEAIKKVNSDFEYYCSDINKDPDKRDYIVSNKKIESYGFKATTSLNLGITQLTKLYSVLKVKNFSNS